MWKLIIVLAILNLTLAGNILFFTAAKGSHMFLAAEIANVLDGEHKITFISQVTDTRMMLNPQINVIIPKGEGFSLSEKEFDRNTAEFLRPTLAVRESENMHVALFATDKESQDAFLLGVKIRLAYLSSEEYVNLVKSGGFDAIVVEDFMYIETMMAIQEMKIPIVSLSPVIDHFNPRRRQNYPFLFNSEPSFTFPFVSKGSPTCKQRFQAVVDTFTMVYRMFSYFKMLGAELAKYGLKTADDGNDQIQLYLINDHPALSFPHLDPPNVLNIGGFHFKSAEPLPQDFTTFIESSNRDLVYVSFGSYCDLNMIPWLGTFLNTLETMEIRVILKASVADLGDFGTLSDKFFVKSWVPQKDLLGSGKVKVFISHCGNNGRMESVFYNVPILCIPLFGDQYMNSLIIQKRNLGRVLSKDVSEAAVIDILNEMIQNNSFYRKNAEIAADILKSEPATGKDKIKYFFNLLVKYGNLNFLKNDIILEQSMLEMHNLDIICLLLVVCIVFVASVVFASVKCWCFVKRKICGCFKKTKRE